MKPITKSFELSNQKPKQEFTLVAPTSLIIVEKIIVETMPVIIPREWYSKLSTYFLKITYRKTGDNSFFEEIKQITNRNPVPMNPMIEYDNFEIPSYDVLEKGVFYDNVVIELKSITGQLMDRIVLRVLYDHFERVTERDDE